MSLLPISQKLRFSQYISLNSIIKRRKLINLLPQYGGHLGIDNIKEPIKLLLLIRPINLIIRLIESKFQKQRALVDNLRLNFNFGKTVQRMIHKMRIRKNGLLH